MANYEIVNIILIITLVLVTGLFILVLFTDFRIAKKGGKSEFFEPVDDERTERGKRKRK